MDCSANTVPYLIEDFPSLYVYTAGETDADTGVYEYNLRHSAKTANATQSIVDFIVEHSVLLNHHHHHESANGASGQQEKVQVNLD